MTAPAPIPSDRLYHSVWMGGSVYLQECIECATLVTDIPRHNKWHEEFDFNAQYIKYLRGDASFPPAGRSPAEPDNSPSEHLTESTEPR